VVTVNCPICSGSRLRGSRWARRGRSVMPQSIEQVFGCQNRLWVKAERWILEDCESPGTRICPRRSDVSTRGCPVSL
jgi:hypothetical protein